jgi:hypothetical protein
MIPSRKYLSVQISPAAGALEILSETDATPASSAPGDRAGNQIRMPRQVVQPGESEKIVGFRSRRLFKSEDA